MAADRPRRFAAWTVQSHFPLAELPAANDPVEWRIVHDVTAANRHGVSWYHHADAADGLPWVWFGRRGPDDVLRFPGLGWCAIDAAHRRIRCVWRKHLQVEESEHLLINHVLPIAASAAGFLVLHASVVVRPGGGAVAFAGPVGAGKSTAALALANQGWPILSDDRLVVDARGTAYPIAPYLRVSREAAAHFGIDAPLPPQHRKVRLRAGQHPISFRDRAVPLERIVFLGATGRPTSTASMGGPDAAIAVLTALLQIGLDRAATQRQVFERVATLAQSVAITELRMAKQWDRLQEMDEALRRA